jgi:hypothetical protein
VCKAGGGREETGEAKRESRERKIEGLNNSYIVSQLRKPEFCSFAAVRRHLLSVLCCFSFEPFLMKMTESGYSSVNMMAIIIIIIAVAFVLFVP